MAEGLVLLAPSVLVDLRAKLVPLALPDLRVMPVNEALLVPKAHEVFRGLLDQLVAELEEPQFLVLKGLGVPLGRRVLPDPLAPPEQMDNQDLRAIMGVLAPLVLLDLRVLLDLLESVVPPVRMPLLLS